jgi:hypothetical protein
MENQRYEYSTQSIVLVANYAQLSARKLFKSRQSGAKMFGLDQPNLRQPRRTGLYGVHQTVPGA